MVNPVKMMKSKKSCMLSQTLYQCAYLFSLLVCVCGTQQFIAEPENKTAIQNSTITLQCKVKNRQGDLQWTRDRLGLGPDRDLPGFARYTMYGGESFVGTDKIEDYSLKIIDLQLEDNAKFQCQVGATSEVSGIISNVVSVTVLIPPDQPRILGATPTIAVVQGVATNITCAANNGKPGADIMWYKDGIRIAHDVIIRTTTIDPNRPANSISSVTITATAADAGKKIECLATNSALRNPLRTNAILDVQFPPRITLSHNVTTNRKLRENQNVRFTCTGTANPFEIIWSWYRNGEQIEGATKNYYDIPDIDRALHGSTVACEGSNAVGSTRAEEILDIEFGPKFTETPSTIGVDVGESVTLTCSAEGNPPADIIWRRKGFIKSPLTTSPSYTIDRVTEDDIGIYTCTASVRTFSDISKDVYLLLKGPPKIVSNTQQYAAEGSDGKIECVARSVPYPETIEWTKNNEVIDYANSGRYSESVEKNPDGIKSTLTVFKTRESDFGKYNCTVANSRGSDIVTVTLIARAKNESSVKNETSAQNINNEILPLSIIIGGVIGGLATIFLIVLACIIYHRHCKSSDADSYAETDSNTEIKKREKSDSPSDFTNKSTLMDQWRQDLNYHCSTDYEDLYGPKNLNSSGYGTLKSDNIINAYENQNGHPIHLYSDYTHTTGEPAENKYENGYNTYGTSSFRSASRTDFSPTYDNSDPYRLPPADITTTKLATNV